MSNVEVYHSGSRHTRFMTEAVTPNAHCSPKTAVHLGERVARLAERMSHSTV